jgi:3-oxoacyl-[acyl-carrier protein] reductase
MTVMVTGGAGTLGAAVASGVLARGHDVVLVDHAQEALDRALTELPVDAPARVHPVVCDITKSDSVDGAWTEAEAALGEIDVVINAVGTITPRPFLELADDQWSRTLDVNLTGPLPVCRRAARSWIPNGTQGSIVNVSSLAAIAVADYVEALDYGASKAGLVGLTIHLAVHLGRHGIRANAIAPASFRSAMNAERLSRPGMEDAATSLVPLRRLAEAEEIASVAIFLALDASYVNGALVPVDGGMAVRM